MSKPLYVSYSGASKFKSCPTKYYLSKKFQDRRISSAFPFGKAIETGVDELLKGESFDKALGAFHLNWNQEKLRGNEYRQVFDNLDLQFYASDFDKGLFVDDNSQKILNEWVEELLADKTKGWVESFDEISERFKAGNEVSDVELAFHNRIIWECCRIRGGVMLKAFYEDILPQIDLTKTEHFAAQREVSMTNEDGDKITGYVDYVVFLKGHGWVILDLKTASQAYAMHALDTSEQLRTYVAAIGDEVQTRTAGYAVLLKKVKVDRTCNKCDAPKEGLARKCKKCGEGEYSKGFLRGETQLILKTYADSELDDLLEDYMNVAVAIKNEVNFKNPANCTTYGRQCEFYDVCWKRKKPEEVDHLESKESK